MYTVRVMFAVAIIRRNTRYLASDAVWTSSHERLNPPRVSLDIDEEGTEVMFTSTSQQIAGSSTSNFDEKENSQR